jgi:RND family efflux transporter MFP subunit
MAGRSLHQLIHHLRRIAAPSSDGLTDANLLGRFADNRDEAAFEALVWRHGPLVYGVCRRLLGQAQDAEDAFQASFLILARKSGSVRRRAAVGPWLYRVAERVARRARSRIRTVDQLPDDVAESNHSDVAESSELRRIVSEEVMRLPKRYRSAVVLRYLEGRTTDEAALALGCPSGTVLSRLAWARQRLRVRLAARGAALPAALACAAFDEAAGAVPARWVTAAAAAAGTFAAGSRTGRPAILAAEVLRAMLMTRLRVGAVVVFGALATGAGLLMPGVSPGRADPEAKAAQQAVDVTVVRPTRRTAGEYEDFVGQTEAATTVDVRSRITSQIEKVAFQPGAKVKRGDVLFELDARAYQVEYERAAAEIQRAEGRLKSAQIDVDRAQMLQKVAGPNASAEAVDHAKIAVDDARAGLLVAKAGLHRAQLDLDATRITSPIDGQTGGTVISVGNLAAPTTTLVTIVGTDPIHVYFAVPENSLFRVQKLVQGRSADAFIRLGSDADFSHRGKVDFVDNRVDPKTGTVRVRATLPNPKGEILPGMYAQIRLMMGENREELLIPRSAVSIAGNTWFVLVVGPDNTIEWRAILPGQRIGDQQAVRAGIRPLDRVITNNLSSITPGAQIRIGVVDAEK